MAGFVGYKIKSGGSSAANILTDTVKKQNLKQTVLATGQVVSSTDLDLSFKVGGIVERVVVRGGAKVKAGQVLANLAQADQAASLTQAEGSLAQAQANYNKVLAGASNEDIAVALVALDNAKTALTNTVAQQKVLVANAYGACLNSTLTAVPGTSNISGATVTVSGTYTGSQQGVYSITVYNTGSGARFNFTGLESGSGDVRTAPVPLGANGLSIQFSSANVNAGDTWSITIPNTQGATYVANYNAYEAALQTQVVSIASAESAVSSAQAGLDLKKAQARPADVQAAQAQILSRRVRFRPLIRPGKHH